MKPDYLRGLRKNSERGNPSLDFRIEITSASLVGTPSLEFRTPSVRFES